MINSDQTIFDDAECRAELNGSENLIEDYMGKQRDITQLFDLINNGELSPQSGSGSPENVIESNYSLYYVDTDVNTLYFNPTYGSKTGWVVV